MNDAYGAPVPNFYAYSPYSQFPYHAPDYRHYGAYAIVAGNVEMSRAAESALVGMHQEASTIDLFSRLAEIAPDQHYNDLIQHALNNKRTQFHQFGHLYTTLTGSQPQYKIHRIDFRTFREGLQIAGEACETASRGYWQSGSISQHPSARNVFLQAASAQHEISSSISRLSETVLKDHGGTPYVVNIEEAAKNNNTYRTAIWTGQHLQVTVMSIEVGDDIGLEVHPIVDQFLRIEEGEGLVQMGSSKERLDFQEAVGDTDAIMVPAGTWHNVTNTGSKPLKLYSIYAPPEHPFGTVHRSKADAMAAEH
ncbi:cupin domain-containing protein [Paenibacillus sp. NPDC058071]|uniref:cupin domain-containing protein n=1 Tax=Paenibacillus sp. NPDC058071 TaxID=3346326 RepID=UPI0036DADC54